MSGKHDDPRWQKLRLKVFDRDEFTCQACGSIDKTLHVHHKRYKGKLWDSAGEDLQTLCEDCHQDLGRHPKGGIWWQTSESGECYWLAVEHCPMCKSESFLDTGFAVTCTECHSALPSPGGIAAKFKGKASVTRGANRLLGVPILRAYLAGKMASPYRGDIVNGYSETNHSEFWDKVLELIPSEDWDGQFAWPEVPLAVRTRDGFDSISYCGPFWTPGENIQCHATNDEPISHGIDSFFWYGHENPPPENSVLKRTTERSDVFDKCMRAIQKTNLLFAWIDSADCYGTLVELGWSKQMCLVAEESGIRRKVVAIAFSNQLDEAVKSDMWFAAECADIVICANTANEAWSYLWSGKFWGAKEPRLASNKREEVSNGS